MIDLLDERHHGPLLGREVRDILAPRDRSAYAGLHVLVTGGGGSIGSALANEVARCGPARVTILEQSEYHLFTIERALADRFPGVAVEGVLGDVTRPLPLDRAVRRARPDLVFHAAAYKHVVMCERAVCPAVRTNVLGTLYAARAAEACGARFVLVSSDKAAEPRSVMGATKRLAELVVLARSRRRFDPVVVRFGNVLGSRGSLLEIVADRIARRLPVEVTDREATRYFMTAREAVSLVMKTGLTGSRGGTYWLDMGEPINVLSLVERAIDLAVEHGAPRVPVTFVGLRTGEKLCEELTSQGLGMRRTGHPRIFTAAQPPVDARAVRQAVRALREDLRRDDASAALVDLRAAVPEFEVSDATWRGSLAQTVGPRLVVPAPSRPAVVA